MRHRHFALSGGMARVRPADVERLADKITSEQQAYGLLTDVLDLVVGRALPLLDSVQIIGGTRAAAADSLQSVISSVEKARWYLGDEGLSDKAKRMTAFAVQQAVTNLENIDAITDKTVWAGIAWGEVVQAGRNIVKTVVGPAVGSALEAVGVPRDYQWLVWTGAAGLGAFFLLKKVS